MSGSKAATLWAHESRRAVVIDDPSPQLCWAGDWQSERFPQAIDSTIAHTNQAGASVTIAFEGSGLNQRHPSATDSIVDVDAFVPMR